MTASFIVVDDFLQDPHGFRNIALGLDYPKPEGTDAYAGRNSSKRVAMNGLDQEVSRLVGTRVEPIRESMHAMCRIALAGDTGRDSVHVDPGQWSGILYLSLPEHCYAGTEFYRHIPTNTDRVPLTPKEQAATGLHSFQDVIDRVLTPDANDETKWEHIMRIPMRFNRLVLFRPWLWHSGGPGFGDCPENGRLVYLMFFRETGVSPAP